LSRLENPVFDVSCRLTILPVVHGSAFFAREVRQRLRQATTRGWDCLAIPLPPSFAAAVEDGVERLPRVSVAFQEEEHPGSDDGRGGSSYVPVDPCQPVIEAIRVAQTASVARAWVDLEVAVWESPEHVALPDPYPLPETGWEAFAAACLPVLPAPIPGSQREERIRHTAHQLHVLEVEHECVVHVCSLADWPWVREAYRSRARYPVPFGRPHMPTLSHLAEDSLYFLLGELPYLTFLYEHRRAEEVAGRSGSEETIDGVKTLLIEARDSALRAERSAACRALQQDSSLTPNRLRTLLQYVRNLTLMDGRMTPQLYDLALASQQVIGDDYALSLIETARQYPPQRIGPERGAGLHLDFRDLAGDTDSGSLRDTRNRLEGVPRTWRNLHLRPTPPAPLREQWRMEWDPFGQCSYPPEDTRIENFQQHVREQARTLLGLDLPKVEKFSASLKDGLDLRETLRNWHTGDLYVKELPPSKGGIEVVVMLFDVPADPAQYGWRSTWYAEHEEESTLCFFATPHEDGIIGPGIGQSLYGGCMFIFPPRPIPDVWTDPRLEGYESLEERLLAAACFHSQERRVVVVSPKAPSPRWRRLARGFGRQFVYLPLRRFSADTVDRLRRFHVLNGRHVRSYAARYIRPPR
jgi:hypothetical protein